MNIGKTPDDPKLVACPFCDGFAHFVEGHKNHWRIECENAGCILNLTVMGKDKPEAAELWNARAGATPGKKQKNV